MLESPETFGFEPDLAVQTTEGIAAIQGFSREILSCIDRRLTLAGGARVLGFIPVDPDLTMFQGLLLQILIYERFRVCTCRP